MNQQACLYFHDHKSVQDLAQSDPDLIFALSNKFRAYAFILEDYFSNVGDFEKALNTNSTLSLHEVLTQFLTYDIVQDNTFPKPIIYSEVQKFWIQDIDCFIGFPIEIQEKLLALSPHIFCYSDLKSVDNLK